uniref:Monopolar spindle protein 2 n=1 Tax=Lygus hesperus TaxID=30085 RepID=A0A0A9Z7N9_LYGHE
MSWDNDRVIALIKEVEKRPVLWKKDDKMYQNLFAKEDAWREIGEVLEDDVGVLKKKMNSIRGSRRREKHRVTTSMRAGKGRNEIYVPKWFAWDSLKFLDDQDEPRITLTNHPATQENDTPPEDSVDGGNHDSPQDSLTEYTSSLVTASKKLFRSPKKMTSRKRTAEDPRLEEAYRILKSKSVPERKDECALFGDFIAAKMRNLEQRRRAMLQRDIYNLVFEAEMNSSASPTE